MCSIKIKILQFIGKLPAKKAYVPPVCRTGSAEEVGLDLLKVIKSKYAGSVKCGEMINSGRSANVFTIEGWGNSYVARVEQDSIFSLKSLQHRYDSPLNPIIAENSSRTISIQRRIQGTPLYGAGWYERIMQKQLESVDNFYQTMNELNALPDETYVDYIKKVIDLREGCWDIDTVNPNNYLLDLVNKRINIVDIEPKYKGAEFIKVQDFFPLINGPKLTQLMVQMTPDECSVLQKQVRNFLDRMIGIAKNEGIKLEMPHIDPKECQDDIVYIYHNQLEYLEHKFKKIRKFFNLQN